VTSVDAGSVATPSEPTEPVIALYFIMGTAGEAEEAARKYINSPMMRRAKNVVLVTANDEWFGSPITIIGASSD